MNTKQTSKNIFTYKNVIFLNTLLAGDVTAPDHRDINNYIVKDNVGIIDSRRNWNVLLQKEAIKIK